jgi:uncharacterized metal-binding protein
MNYELRITELRNHKKEQRNISDPEVNKVIYGIQTQRHQDRCLRT